MSSRFSDTSAKVQWPSAWVRYSNILILERSNEFSALTEHPDPRFFKKLFKFWDYTVATLEKRIMTIHLVPRDLLLFIIKYSWEIDMIPRHLHQFRSIPDSFVRPRPPLPPSLRQQIAAKFEDQRAVPPIRFQDSYSRLMATMDIECGGEEISLVWQSEVTPYPSDLKVYIW